MQDFNLRPEIMGFGRPERLLAPAPTQIPIFKRPLVGQALASQNAKTFATKPENSWTSVGVTAGFEVNGLGQLRTVLALPASEREIAANMRHADAPPIPRPVINKGSEPRTIVGSATFAHDPKTCMCDGCAIERMNRWAPQPGEDRRPLIDQLKARHPELTTPQAPAKTVGQASREELLGMVVALAAHTSTSYVRDILKQFGGDNVAAIPFFRHHELKKHLQAELDIPF